MLRHNVLDLVSAALIAAFAVGARVGDDEFAGVTADEQALENSEAGANGTKNAVEDQDLECANGHKHWHPPARPYNCHRNLEYWESMWPAAKKEWCCFHENVACKSEHFDCGDGLLYWETEWSDMKKEWCCHNHNMGCPKCDDFLCPETHDKLRMAVAGSVKCVKWPCKNSECCELWGNMDLERLPTNAPTPLPTFDPTPTPTIAPTPDEDRFHCTSAIQDSLLGWSLTKKEWCCFNRNIGCKDMHSEHIVSNEPHGEVVVEHVVEDPEDDHHHVVHHYGHSVAQEEHGDSDQDAP